MKHIKPTTKQSPRRAQTLEAKMLCALLDAFLGNGDADPNDNEAPFNGDSKCDTLL